MQNERSARSESLCIQWKALPTLPARERMVLTLRYGLEDGVVHPQHEIAERLGISRSYVSRSWYCKRCPKAGRTPSGVGVLLSRSGHSSFFV